MFFIPYATDAILYYRPIGTFLLIAANIVCFILTGFSAETELGENFMLEFGNGMHPQEWISCHFLHLGIFHLLGNMLFLFIFGIIVEGKIGTIPFLILYFIIGWMGASLTQAMWQTGTSAPGWGGASLVIFGLMMISLLWAPRNEVSIFGFVIFFFVPRVYMFEVSVLALGIFYFCLEVIGLAFSEFSMSSAMLHVLGGLIGGGIGVAMLKLKWVDCEGWDVFSLMKEDPTQKSMEYYKEELYAAYPNATRTEALPDLPFRKNGPAPAISGSSSSGCSSECGMKTWRPLSKRARISRR